MNIYEQYQQDALRTEAPTAEAMERLGQLHLVRLTHAALGLVSDLWELKTSHDTTNEHEEIGDCLWFINLGKFALERTLNYKAIEDPAYILGDGNRELRGFTQDRDCVEFALQHACELADEVKAKLFYGKELFDPPAQPNRASLTNKWDFERIVDHRLDKITAALSYMCLFHLHVAPQTIMGSNIAKLRARFPKAYSQARALDRDKEAERTAINAGSSGPVPSNIPTPPLKSYEGGPAAAQPAVNWPGTVPCAGGQDA